MHDLLFTYDFPPMGGGIARCMAALAQHYPPGGLIVSTGSITGSAPVDAALPNRVDRLATPTERLRTIPGLLRWSSRAVDLAADPAARFAWCGTLRPAAYPAWWARKRTGLPYGVIVYGGDLLILRHKLVQSPWKRRIATALFNDAAAIVAISEWTANSTRQLLQHFAMREPGTRLHTVPLGTDPEQWQKSEQQTEAFRGARGLPEGQWLVTVARLVPHKGIDTGIRVLAGLRSEFPTLRYAVVGRGEYLEALRRLASEMDVSDRVHFLTDVTDAELPDAYALGDVYLGLSRETATEVEGFGIALLEAGAMRLPVVAGESGGVPDAVANGVTGQLVDPLNPNEAILAVRALLSNPELARLRGASGHARVVSHFNWLRFTRDMQAIAASAGRTA